MSGSVVEELLQDPRVVGVGEKLVFLTRDGRAVFTWRKQTIRDDGLIEGGAQFARSIRDALVFSRISTNGLP